MLSTAVWLLSQLSSQSGSQWTSAELQDRSAEVGAEERGERTTVKWRSRQHNARAHQNFWKAIKRQKAAAWASY